MKERGGFRVLLDTYVTEDSGTGVVHQAPYFGEVCLFIAGLIIVIVIVCHALGRSWPCQLAVTWIDSMHTDTWCINLSCEALCSFYCIFFPCTVVSLLAFWLLFFC